MLRGLHKNVHSFPQSTFQYRIYRKELWYHGMPYMSAALTKTQNTKVIFLSDGFLILHQKTKLNECWKSKYNVLIPLFIADVLNSSVFIIHKTFFFFFKWREVQSWVWYRAYNHFHFCFENFCEMFNLEKPVFIIYLAAFTYIVEKVGDKMSKCFLTSFIW